MNSFLEGAATVALAVIGLAMVAILISRRSNTAGIIQASASGLANNIGVAISPVTGGNFALNLDYPANGSFGF